MNKGTHSGKGTIRLKAADGNETMKNEEGTDRGIFQTLLSDLFCVAGYSN